MKTRAGIFANPILGRELGELLRSRRVYIAELVFLGLLSLAVYLGWPQELVKVADRAQRSEKLFILFASVETLLVALIAPVFSASAFTSEKETRCFELLYVTPLARGSILVGKLISSILVLLIVVLSSAPLTAVCLILGGVSGGQVLGLFMILLSTAVLFGIVGIGCSIHFERTYASLGTSYLIILPIILFLVFVFSAGVNVLLPLGIILSMITATAAAVRFRTLRRKLGKPPEIQWDREGLSGGGEDEDWTYQSPMVAVFRRDRFPDRLLFPSERVEPMPDNVNPVTDRELRGESFSFGILLVRMLIQISIALSLLFLVFVLAGSAEYFGFFLLCFLILVGPSLGSSAISLERERRTLDLLVTTGIRAGKIIRGKLFVSTRLSVILTLILMPPLLVGLFPRAQVTWWTILAMLAEVFAVAFFINVVGLACSTVAKRTVQSMISTYAVIVALFAGVHILGTFLALFTDFPREGLESMKLVSPFWAVSGLVKAFSPAEAVPEAVRAAAFGGWTVHLCILAAASAAVLVGLRWQFGRLVRDR